MIYPTGYHVQWRKDIPPRRGAQSGVLAQPWLHYGYEFPCVRWDGEQDAGKVPPECLEPPQRQQASIRDTWTRERQAVR